MCYYTKLQHRDAFEKLISSYILRNTVPLDNDDDEDDDDAVMLLREEIIKYVCIAVVFIL